MTIPFFPRPTSRARSPRGPWISIGDAGAEFNAKGLGADEREKKPAFDLFAQTYARIEAEEKAAP